jgi:hypothetical protein
MLRRSGTAYRQKADVALGDRSKGAPVVALGAVLVVLALKEVLAPAADVRAVARAVLVERVVPAVYPVV